MAKIEWNNEHAPINRERVKIDVTSRDISEREQPTCVYDLFAVPTFLAYLF